MSDTWMSYTAQLSIPMPPPSQFLRFSQGIVFQASFQIKVKSILMNLVLLARTLSDRSMARSEEKVQNFKAHQRAQ